MSVSLNGSTQYLTIAAPITVAPWTASLWIKKAVATDLQTVFCLFNAASGDLGWECDSYGSGSGNKAVIWCAGNSCGVVGTSDTNWHNYIFMAASTSSRTAYEDGVAGTTSTGLVTTSGVDTLAIGVLTYNGGFIQKFNGLIAEECHWNVALTQAEITALAKGFPPSRIRPQSRVGYYPLLRGPNPTKGGVLTLAGTPTYAAHPRRIY